MKIALITDTHYGIYGDSLPYLKYQQKFMDNVFFPYLRKNEIRHVFHLGDLVDKKTINLQTLSFLNVDLLRRFDQSDLNLFIIPGNHDCFFKNTNIPNAVSELIKENNLQIKNVFIQSLFPGTLTFGDIKILMVPWINKENREGSFEIIAKSDADFCFGHLELKGFDMGDGRIAEHGFDSSEFEKFKLVVSGHYHTRSKKGNILYMGSAFHDNWSSYNDFRGFVVLDTETNKINFIKNPYNFFYKVDYDDDKLIVPSETDITGNIVRVYKKNVQNEAGYEKWLLDLEALNPFRLTIIENEVAPVVFVESEETDSTVTIFRNSIEQSNHPKREKLMTLAEDVYKEALQIQ